MSKYDRAKVLDHLAELATDEDTSQPVLPVFLPLLAHKLALRPDVVVVLGPRGAGKTALFKVVQELGASVRVFFDDPAIPDATWLDAYSELSTEHPAGAALDQLAESRVGQDDGALRAFWAVHLLSRLSKEGVRGADLPAAVRKVVASTTTDPTAWVATAQQNIGAVMAALDQVERSLAVANQTVFATYDHLDRLGLHAPDRSLRARLVRTLLSLWLSNATRYRRLRAKIFLRPDIFDEVATSFPDATKLRPRAVDVSWDVESLYRLVIRHLANRGPHLTDARAWLSSATRPLVSREGVDAGLFPGPMPESEQARFARALAGESMGKGPKKGYVYRWIPARLKDAGGAIVPRSFTRLLGYAARRQRDVGPRKSGPLMDPSQLVGALDDTSIDRVAELQDEYVVVGRLENLRNLTLLLDEEEVQARLSVAAKKDGYKNDGAAVVEELRRIGVLQFRADGRVDIPDIYRYGYGIKRRGGAARPR